jgi:hypothetical protein
MANINDSKIWCENVYVKRSGFSTEVTGEFDGAFARKDFKEGELIEKGVMRRLPDGFDGNKCPYIFTWSNERPNHVWAMGSGCSAFYNTNKENVANTRMVRYFDEDRFEIFASRDINKDEELTHTYLSLRWRECFSELSELLS